MDYLEIKDDQKPNVIPCIGATNESNIVSILTGWGYKYKCLLDNDSEGIKVYESLKKSLDNYENILFFVNDTYDSTIESLLSEDVKQKIDVGSKTLNAKKFATLIKQDKKFLDKDTENNFNELLSKLGII